MKGGMIPLFASILVGIFCLIIPPSFKKMGLQLMLDDKKWGIHLVHFSKLMFWSCAILTLTIWINSALIPYAWSALPFIVAVRIYWESHTKLVFNFHLYRKLKNKET